MISSRERDCRSLPAVLLSNWALKTPYFQGERGEGEREREREREREKRYIWGLLCAKTAYSPHLFLSVSVASIQGLDRDRSCSASPGILKPKNMSMTIEQVHIYPTYTAPSPLSVLSLGVPSVATCPSPPSPKKQVSKEHQSWETRFCLPVYWLLWGTREVWSGTARRSEKTCSLSL